MDALEHSSTTVYLFVSEVLSPPGIFSLVVRGQRLMPENFSFLLLVNLYQFLALSPKIVSTQRKYDIQ